VFRKRALMRNQERDGLGPASSTALQLHPSRPISIALEIARPTNCDSSLVVTAARPKRGSGCRQTAQGLRRHRDWKNRAARPVLLVVSAPSGKSLMTDRLAARPPGSRIRIRARAKGEACWSRICVNRTGRDPAESEFRGDARGSHGSKDSHVIPLAPSSMDPRDAKRGRCALWAKNPHPFARAKSGNR